MKLTRKNIIFFSHSPNKSRFEKWSIINSHSFPLIFFPSILSEKSVPFVVLFFMSIKRATKYEKKPLIFSLQQYDRRTSSARGPLSNHWSFYCYLLLTDIGKKGVSREHPALSRKKKKNIKIQEGKSFQLFSDKFNIINK